MYYEINERRLSMGKQITRSTGVLRREPDTVTAVVNLVNVDDSNHDVTVEVWDWSSYSNPVMLPVLIGNNEIVDFPYFLAPENLAVMYADITGVLFYEIVISHPDEENIIVNCFGRSPNLTAQEGNTVLDNQLVQLDLDCD